MKFTLLFSALFIAVLSVVYFVPGYLRYHDEPIKADAVIFFVGPDYEAREELVKKLIDNGYAPHLLIPFYRKVLSADRSGNIVNIDRATIQDNIAARAYTHECYPANLENTHIEALEAKKSMDALGLRTAICVSSPYHMRRIKLIVDRVFKANEYRITCLPAVSESRNRRIWFSCRDHVVWVISESLKIGWFYLYEPFMRAAIERKS